MRSFVPLKGRNCAVMKWMHDQALGQSQTHQVVTRSVVRAVHSDFTEEGRRGVGYRPRDVLDI